jgi:type II secretory ATPase GspE/PulE/Tfp pilus assembly ATPase PilB-like protein
MTKARQPSNPAPLTTDASTLVQQLFHRALALQASDIHFEPMDDPEIGLLVRVRLDGLLHDVERIPRSVADSVIGRLKVVAGLLTYRIDIPQEGSLQLPHPDAQVARPGKNPIADGHFSPQVQLRVATFPTIRGERIVVRIFSDSTDEQQLDDLGFDHTQIARLKAAVESPAGMILLTGPAGAGKTTTLYALLRHLRDRHPQRSIITVEDPVEQRLDRVTQIQINPHGQLDYEVCMRSLLRQDPQVLLIGEIRDARTAAVAIDAALTGHLILTTVHGGDPAEAVVRLLEMGIPAYQVVSAVTLVGAQRLLRRTVTPYVGLSRNSPAHARRSMDVDQCHLLDSNDGPVDMVSPTRSPRLSVLQRYCGRVACGQIINIDETLRQLILQNPTATQLRRAMAGQDLAPMIRAGDLLAAGITDREEVLRVFGEAPAPTAAASEIPL